MHPFSFQLIRLWHGWPSVLSATILLLSIFTQVRLDHRSQTVSFGTDLNIALQEDVEEGPFLQHMPGEQLRNQLQHMAKALSKAISKLGATDVEQVTVTCIFYLPCHLLVLFDIHTYM